MCPLMKKYKQSLVTALHTQSLTKIGFWLIWLVLVLLGPYVISKTVVFPKVFSDYGLTLNFLERLSGVFIFTLLFIQIVLGAYLEKLTSKFGGWIFKVHAIQGPVIYLLALIHPLFLFVFNYKVFHTLDPFYIYTQACLLCKTNIEFFYTLGRLSIWFLTIGVFAALFRSSDNWLKKNWRKIHLLNYFVFFFVAIHAWFVGSDFHISPLKYFYWLSIILVTSTLFFACKQSRRQERLLH